MLWEWPCGHHKIVLIISMVTLIWSGNWYLNERYYWYVCDNLCARVFLSVSPKDLRKIIKKIFHQVMFFTVGRRLIIRSLKCWTYWYFNYLYLVSSCMLIFVLTIVINVHDRLPRWYSHIELYYSCMALWWSFVSKVILPLIYLKLIITIYLLLKTAAQASNSCNELNPVVCYTYVDHKVNRV